MCTLIRFIKNIIVLLSQNNVLHLQIMNDVISLYLNASNNLPLCLLLL